MICRSNQLTGFYMMGILVVKGLIQILVVLVKSLKSNSHKKTNYGFLMLSPIKWLSSKTGG